MHQNIPQTSNSQNGFRQLLTACHHICLHPASIHLPIAQAYFWAPYHHQLTRPGIALTGTPPDDEAMGTDGITPAYCWTADILQIRQISAGETVGYGADFTAKTPMRLATIGAGYADGFRANLAQPHLRTMWISQGCQCHLSDVFQWMLWLPTSRHLMSRGLSRCHMRPC